MTDYTTDHRLNLEAYLASRTLPSGLGNKESACTLAAINLAMSGRLTDEIPACMSEVLGKAAISLQDAMPDEMRNSQRYKRLIPDMPGTGRAQEQERLAILMEWMWGVVLPQVQPIADKRGLGVEWRQMCHDRMADAARAARADAAAAAYAAATVYAAAARAAATADIWATVDPIGVLERMTYLTGAKP